MTARLFTIGFAWVLSGIFPVMFFCAVAVAQTPAAISYGSITTAENSLLSAVNFETNPETKSGQFAPIFVAQNTPASITPIPSTPTTLPPANSAAMLPHIDPYAVSPQTAPFGTIFPMGTVNSSGGGTSGLGQTAPANIYSGNFDRFVPETYEAIRRFREATTFEYTHLPKGNGADAFGMDEIELRTQLAFPCRFIPNNGRTGYFYVAPACSLAWWNGPVGPPHMSPNGFGAFLDFGVQPKFNDMFSLIAWGRVGVFSDFERMSSDAIRYQGRLEGVVHTSAQIQYHAGVIYYGRSRVKMLPTLGVVWTPDDDWVLKLMFPNPKIYRRLWTGPQADWWGYVHLDYAGGSWDINGINGLTDYNDIRLGAGIEFSMPNQIGGYFEFGGSFDRELYSHSESPRRWASPPSVLYIKTGIIF